MALVDFYQLAALYKPRCVDTGVPSIHSHPLTTMSATTPPRSPSPTDESNQVYPNQVHSPLPPHMQAQFTTPERNRGPTNPVPGITPLSRGSSVRQRQEGDTDRMEKYTRGDYDDYVREDLRSRVFVDFEVFMMHVLHVPKDWKTRWKPAIEAVGVNEEFKAHLEAYCRLCDSPTSLEELFYEPLVDISTAALRVLSGSNFDGISSGIPQHYQVNASRKVEGGIFNRAGLSPDLVVLHKDCDPTEKQNIHWANILHVLEVKPSGNTICDGTNIPRLVVNSKCQIRSVSGYD
jgi:hypothetical protein